MTTLREAAQQALEVLEQFAGTKLVRTSNVITALRTALAEPEQWHCDDCGGTDPECPNKPQRTEPEQEPVAWIHEDELPSNYPYDLMFPYSKVNGVRLFPVFGPFPQRKPLTDEEIADLLHPLVVADLSDVQTDYEIARAIERAHGIGGEA